MIAYTLTNTYCATGEGMTHWLMYMYAESEQHVRDEFVRREDPYFLPGVEIREGFDFDCYAAKLLLTEPVRKTIEGRDCNVAFFATFHFNYS